MQMLRVQALREETKAPVHSRTKGFSLNYVWPYGGLNQFTYLPIHPKYDLMMKATHIYTADSQKKAERQCIKQLITPVCCMPYLLFKNILS